MAWLPKSVRVLSPEVQRTFRYDTVAGLAWGAFSAGGVATAAIISKKYFLSSNFEIALLYSATGVGFLATLMTSRWVQRRAAMPLVVWPEVIASLLFIAVAFASKSWMFSLFVSMSYALLGSIQPALAHIYKANYPDSVRGSVYALVRLGAMLTSMVGAQLIGMMLDVHPDWYVYGYPALGLLGLIGAYVFSRIAVAGEKQRFVGETEAPRQTLSVFWKILYTNKPFAAFMVVWGLFGFANHIINPIRAIYLTDPIYGIDAGYTASILVLVVLPQAVMILTLRMWGRLLDRIPVTTLRVPLHVLTTLSIALWAVSDSLVLLGLAGVLWGVAMGGGQVMWHVGIFEFAPENQVSLYVGIHVSLTGIRAIVGPHLGNLLVGWLGISATFWFSTLLCGISVVMIVWLARVMKQREIGRYGHSPDGVRVASQ